MDIIVYTNRFILTLKTWSSLRAVGPTLRPVSPTGWKLGQVRENWLCREHMPWNDGILECWNAGFSGMRSVFIKMVLIRI